MDLSLVFVLAIVAYLLGSKLIPRRKRVARFVCMSVLFIVQTAPGPLRSMQTGQNSIDPENSFPQLSQVR